MTLFEQVKAAGIPYANHESMKPNHVTAMQQWEQDGLHFGQIATKLRDTFHMDNETAQDTVEQWMRARCLAVAERLRP